MLTVTDTDYSKFALDQSDLTGQLHEVGKAILSDPSQIDQIISLPT